MHLKLVHLIILQNQTVLLLKRQNTSVFDGLYALPGGKCEAHESLETAAAREAKEELGITVTPDQVKLLHQSITVSPTEPDVTYLNSFVEIVAYEGNIENAEPEKCAELKFYDLSELPGQMIPFARKGLEKSLRSRS
jgi:ADP-ribose pyrophosphatase YjhB (NUDIX family)